ncbi:sensor domain-containing diguanylate cyclase [Actinotalea sp. K2]|uniref:sensor domain-containing diguanylate cyclase n=1 Tax=Actinotalea sp. K2 TaxID=2939438 RepID=UPI0020183E73|nr:sensor domain-containing diguanylate cyclase [Actinotalea sp. K2]MCL3860997.1 GGDEF domain-containing protein [Actinotalea sp. K2]
MGTAQGADAGALGEVLDLLNERIVRYRVSDLQILYCNTAWADAVGLTPEAVTGLTMCAVLPPDELTGLFAQVARLGTESSHLINIQRSGDRWTEWSDLYLTGPGGTHILAVGRDVTDRQDAEMRLAASEERYRELALRDALTGLANRRLLDELLASALARTRRDGHRLVVSYLDLDGFKEVNDEHGHAVGDAVLVECGRRLREGLRESDVVARVGGDEFVVVQECLPGKEGHAAARLAAIMAPDYAVEGLVLPCSASTGSVVAEPHHDAAGLVAAADEAMYTVKRGRAAARL